MSAPRGRSVPGVAFVVFRKEVREILRDRRALLVAFVLPVLLYPVLSFAWRFAGEKRGELASRPLPIAVIGLPHDLPSLLQEHALVLHVWETDEDWSTAGDVYALLEVTAPPSEAEDEGHRVPPESRFVPDGAYRLEYRSTSEASREARRRVRAAIADLRHRRIERGLRERGAEIRYDEYLRANPRDLASPTERRNSNSARLLPLLLVLLLLTGGSFAAIDLVAGEKERGTLETLHVHPVDGASVVRGKFAVVLAVSLVAVVLNCVAIYVGASWTTPADGDANPLLVPPTAGALLAVAALAIPFAVLTSASMLALSAYARSYREAQTYLFPVTLVAVLLAGLGVAPGVQLGGVVAVVPIANVTAGMRHALAGTIEPTPFAIALVSTVLYAALALRGTRILLAREDIVLGLAAPARREDFVAETRGRRALVFGGLLILLGVYYGGAWLQSRDLVWGLVLTLWGIVLLPALLYPLVFRLNWREALALRAPSIRHLGLAASAALALAVVALGYLSLQEKFLPSPQLLGDFGRELAEIPLGLRVFLIVISPAICEEILWRGAVQGELELARRPVRTALWIGVLFGAFHLSIHRFVVTFALGVALATLRHRSRSIVPCMVFHGVYNGVLLAVVSSARGEEWQSTATRPGVWLPAIAVAVLCLSAVRRGDARGGA